MRFLRARMLVLAGLGIIVIGFGYDMRFAGLPFQDPEPDVQANWLYHTDMANRIYAGGIITFLIGSAWAMVGLVTRTLNKRG